MTKSESYVPNVREKEIETLAIQDSVYQPYNEKFLSKIGLKPGMQVADIGCGTGNMTCWLAKQVGSKGRVIGFDISNEQLEIARKKATDANQRNVEFVERDICALDEFNEQFDLVYCRFLLTNLKDPDSGLKKMAQLVKPGGILACGELDYCTWFCYPPSKYFDQHIELFLQLDRAKGLHPDVGPRVFQLFRNLGFASVVIELAQPVLSKMQKHIMELFTLESAQDYLDYGLIDKVGLDTLIPELQKLADDDDFLLGAATLFQVASIKPAK